MTLNKVVPAELEINVWISCIYLEKESMPWIRGLKKTWVTARFLKKVIKCMITFAKMETWKPDTVGKVQEFYTGRVRFPISVCHQRGKASAQAVKIPQELPQTNLQTSQVKPVLNITGHLESRHMLAFVFVFCVFPLYFLKITKCFKHAEKYRNKNLGDTCMITIQI